VHGQAKRELVYFGYSVLAFFTIHAVDWLVNEMPKGGKLVYAYHTSMQVHGYIDTTM
jgi:hypothetical protein